MRHDKSARLRFGSLQGSTATSLVPDYASEAGLSTVVLRDASGTYVRSSAVLRALTYIGGFYGFLAAVGRLIPRALRDTGYKFVAKNRYRWFGHRDTCRLPTPAERARFVD